MAKRFSHSNNNKDEQQTRSQGKSSGRFFVRTDQAVVGRIRVGDMEYLLRGGRTIGL